MHALTEKYYCVFHVTLNFSIFIKFDFNPSRPSFFYYEQQNKTPKNRNVASNGILTLLSQY